MGTRCGDVDPSLVEHIALKEGMSLREMDTLLNKQSGLFGVSGLTSDMRELLDEEREHGIGARRWQSICSCAASGTTSAPISPSSAGPRRSCSAEASARTRPRVRRRVCDGLGWLGIELDPAKNATVAPGTEGEVGADGARVRLAVIPTDEERMIARETVAVLAQRPAQVERDPPPRTPEPAGSPMDPRATVAGGPAPEGGGSTCPAFRRIGYGPRSPSLPNRPIRKGDHHGKGCSTFPAPHRRERTPIGDDLRRLFEDFTDGGPRARLRMDPRNHRPAGSRDARERRPRETPRATMPPSTGRGSTRASSPAPPGRTAGSSTSTASRTGATPAGQSITTTRDSSAAC